MLAQLKTVVLIKEAIKLAFFRLVEYLEHQHLWVRLQAQNGQKLRTFLKLVSLLLFWEMEAIPCEKLLRNWRSRTTLCPTPFTEQCKLALTRIEREVGGPGAQLSKRTSTLECLVWERLNIRFLLDMAFSLQLCLEDQHPRGRNLWGFCFSN